MLLNLPKALKRSKNGKYRNFFFQNFFSDKKRTRFILRPFDVVRRANLRTTFVTKYFKAEQKFK
jgi:hypothetical protein